MGGRTCDHESAVRAMVRFGQDDPELRAHLARCEACRQTSDVTAWMIRFADLPVESVRLPDPGIVWWKAQLVQRWDAQRRATEPIERGQQFQVGVGVAGCVVLFVWLWPHLQSWGARLATPDVSALASAAPNVLVTTLALTGLLAAATVLVAVRAMFAD